MKNRTLLLAGLVEEDDFEETRHAVVENYEEQFEDDRKNISEAVSFVEEDKIRLNRLIGEAEEETEWEGSKALNENIAMGGLGPGFVGAQGYGLSSVSSRYTPSQAEAFGSIIGSDYHKASKFEDLSNTKAALFSKIAEMSDGAFSFGQETIHEDELPKFDANFNPILSENEETVDFFSDELSEKENTLNNKLLNGELAVEGGIGPGFEAYDGVKQESINPWEKAEEIKERWYLNHLDEGSMDDIVVPERDKDADFTNFLAKQAQDIMGNTEGRIGMDELAQRLGLDMANPSEREILERVMGQMGLNEMKEQPDLPGELEEPYDFAADIDKSRYEDLIPDEEVPNTINLATMTLNYIGEQRGNHIYQIDGDDAMVGVSKDLEQGWYAQVRDAVMGLVGEGEGETIEDAVMSALQGYTGNQQELPSTLAEVWEERDTLEKSGGVQYFVVNQKTGKKFGPYKSRRSARNAQDKKDNQYGGYIHSVETKMLSEQTVEGTDGNPWFYRRTGTPDGYNLRFREDKPTMHPEAPEEPSSEGHPGLKGWQFYDADHTNQKMNAQMDDVLDFGEADAIDRALNELFAKNSISEE